MRQNIPCADCDWPDLYWRRIIRPDESSEEKDRMSSINPGGGYSLKVRIGVCREGS